MRSKGIKTFNKKKFSLSFTFGCNSNRFPPPPVVIPTNFSITTAIELMQLTADAYTQYNQFKNNNEWTILPPYELKNSLYVYEKNEQGGGLPIPFGFIAEKIIDANNVDLYICFRGTKNVEDWKKNISVPLVSCPFLPLDKNIKVHKGFQDVYIDNTYVNSLRSQVLDYLNKRPVSSYNNLWVAGHSLGGAVATLAIIDIITNTSHSNVKMYNFASPLVGNQEFADFFKSKIGTNKCNDDNNINACSWRVVNKNDVVTKIPPTATGGYIHVNGCSGQSVCNNVSNNNNGYTNVNNGIFQIEVGKECGLSSLFFDPKCFISAHVSDAYLNELLRIKLLNQ